LFLMLPNTEANGKGRNLAQGFGLYWIREKITGLSATDALSSLRAKSAEQQSKLNERINQLPFLRTKDKVSFVLGITLLLFIQYVILETPKALPVYYTLLLFPLLFYRFFTYHKSKYHYFMLDFCYYMQVWTLLLVWFYPTDVVYFKVFFGLSNGPLLFAIIMWKNRVVFHDLDKLTSLFIHIMPPLVSHVFRFLLSSDPQFMFATPSPKQALTRTDFIYMVFFYALWQFFYWLKVEVVDKRKLENDKTIVTSAKWLSEYQPHPVYVSLKRRFPFITPQGTLIATQLVYTGLTLLLIPFMYNNREFHAAVLIFTFGVACWYGASFYFDSFTDNYTKRLEKIVDKFKNPEKYKEAKDLDVIGKYCPRPRSFVVFIIYFTLAITVLFVCFKYTIWDEAS